MAVTVAVIAVTFPALVFAQDTYATPVRTVGADSQALSDSGSILLGEVYVDAAGNEPATAVDDLCPLPPGGIEGSLEADPSQSACMKQKGFQRAMDHQPPSRFWRFQAIQALILLVASAILAATAIVRTVRRRT